MTIANCNADFIRDPDDPEFHPVRDVLERNVTTQLRKILFSAFVYGALVIVCLGGVVWGLSLTLPNVLPIHYSSNEPVLEFPIDLLFYNFLMPLAVKFFKPSDGLHAMYTWWFRKCARGLRITWFLFGDRRIDEEGTLVLPKDSPAHQLPWWRKMFLEVHQGWEVIPKTWDDFFEGGASKPVSYTPSPDHPEINFMSQQKKQLVEHGQLIPDGRFVRSPASDQVKIPKGRRVFLDVTEHNARMDEKPDVPETDLYSSSQYQFVYVPPHFRVRIFLFILFIWMFAAMTGVGFTIVPLVFGRRMFKLLIPSHIRTNDIYAFSIGIYILGSVAYSIFHIRAIYAKIRSWAIMAAEVVYNRDAPVVIGSVTLRGLKVGYAYSMLLFVFPMLLTALMELYVIIPLHTYMYPLHVAAPQVQPTTLEIPPGNRHTIKVIQAWTLGLLYLKLGARLLTSVYEGTRLAAAVRAVLRRGWLHPNVDILTRAFVIPGLAISLLAMFGPVVITRSLIKRGLLMGFGEVDMADPVVAAMVYRLSYPAAAVSACGTLSLWSLIGVFNKWKARIRDEAYLIGERLHNFGVGGAGGDRARRAWRAGGPRL
jgi:E3 ubiquitin-protein ligase MARCH6